MVLLMIITIKATIVIRITIRAIVTLIIVMVISVIAVKLNGKNKDNCANSNNIAYIQSTNSSNLNTSNPKA